MRNPAAVIAVMCFGCLSATAIVLPQFGNDAAGRPSTTILVMEPEQISSSQLADFVPVETALARIGRDAQGDPRLNAATESALSNVMTALPEAMRPQALERFDWLVHKSFPGTAGAELALLVRDYHRYRQAELTDRRALASPRDLDAEIEQFASTVALRKRYFGAARADLLFGRQQALASHLFDLRRLEATPGLSEQAREMQRRALQADYEKRTHPVAD